MDNRRFFVYIMSNVSRTLYVGVTNNIERRVWEHRQKQAGSFTRDYNITMLVYIEEHGHADDAIAREKQLKKWRREKKVRLIEQENPEWLDLAHEWFRDRVERPGLACDRQEVPALRSGRRRVAGATGRRR